jgi:UDP-glucose 4-epimerase
VNILLTGGAGYIGTHTAVALCAAGHHPILFDNFSNSHKEFVNYLPKICEVSIPCIKGDIADITLLKKVMLKYRVEAVIHFAGFKSTGESVSIPIDYYKNNVCGSLSLLSAMRQAEINTLIFSSSASVYGIPKYLPLDEKHSTIPLNPYGRSKWYVEEMLRDLALSNPQWRIACLRYFNPVGAHLSGLIGEHPRGIPNNLLPYIVGVASGRFPYLNIFGSDYGTSDGTGIRDYIHVMDLAEGHVAALNFLDNDLENNSMRPRANEISYQSSINFQDKRYEMNQSNIHFFNIGTGIGVSVLEMVKAFEKVTEISIPIKLRPRRPGDVSSCYAGVDKALHHLKWRASRSLDEMCSSAWAFERFLQSKKL